MRTNHLTKRFVRLDFKIIEDYSGRQLVWAERKGNASQIFRHALEQFLFFFFPPIIIIIIIFTLCFEVPYTLYTGGVDESIVM